MFSKFFGSNYHSIKLYNSRLIKKAINDNVLIMSYITIHYDDEDSRYVDFASQHMFSASLKKDRTVCIFSLI